jgi:hypothetical protein
MSVLVVTFVRDFGSRLDSVFIKMSRKTNLLRNYYSEFPGLSKLSKIWRAGFNPVWTQMVATFSTCCEVVTFLIK